LQIKSKFLCGAKNIQETRKGMSSSPYSPLQKERIKQLKEDYNLIIIDSQREKLH
jgi:hypothetical protein